MRTTSFQPTSLLLILLAVLMVQCKQPTQAGNASKRGIAITEIAKAEENFANVCAKQGLQKAFATFSDDSAHMRSNDSLISGKKSIVEYYGQPFFKNVSLQWKPDFIDVGESGDIGYTYGHYTFIMLAGKGKNTTKGIYHTVWKKKNGTWKFVWDS